ncbi:hypothetical protein Dimus_007510 [Dionaea muscipula]
MHLVVFLKIYAALALVIVFVCALGLFHLFLTVQVQEMDASLGVDVEVAVVQAQEMDARGRVLFLPPRLLFKDSLGFGGLFHGRLSWLLGFFVDPAGPVDARFAATLEH